MHILKSAILTLLLVIAVLFGFMVFKFDTQYALKLTERKYDQKNYVSALETLEKIKKKSAKAHLYQGYTLRALDKYKAAQNAFEKAYHKAEAQELKHEASFNLLYTAYLQSDYPYIRSHLAKIPQDLSFTQLFSALCEYQAKNYSKAFSHFNQMKKPQFYSSWMKEAWQDEFPKLWQISHRAHCLIEMGEFDASRKLLEEHLEDQEATSYTTYLLALGYLKEIPTMKTLEEALNLFELSSLYAKHLSKDNLAKLYSFSRFTEYCLPLWSLALERASLDSFDRWTKLQLYLDLFTPDHQAKILESLDMKIQHLSPASFFAKANKLNSLPWSHDHQEKLENIHLNYISELIEEENLEPLNLHQSAAQKLLSWNDDQKQKISKLILEKLQTLVEEENSLSDMYDLLLLWDSIERDEAKRLVFIQNVFPLIQELSPKETKMAVQLAKWAEQFSHPSQKAFVQSSLSELFKHSKEAQQLFNP